MNKPSYTFLFLLVAILPILISCRVNDIITADPTATAVVVNTPEPTPMQRLLEEPANTIILEKSILDVSVENQQIKHTAPQVSDTNLRPQPQIIFEGSIGGQRRILGRYQDYVYVGVSNEFIVYDISDTSRPIIVNRKFVDFNTFDEMVIYGEKAVLTTYGFESGRTWLVDLSNPIDPKFVEEIAGLTGRIVQNDNLVFLQHGYIFSDVMILDLDYYPDQLPKNHFINTLNQYVFEQIDLNTEKSAPEYRVQDFLLQGDLWIMAWQTDACVYSGEEICQSGIFTFDISNPLSPMLLYKEIGNNTIYSHFNQLDQNGVLSFDNNHTEINLAPYIPSSLSTASVDSPWQTLAVDSDTLLGPLAGERPTGIAVYEDIAYITTKLDGGNLYVLDISELPTIKPITKLSGPSGKLLLYKNILIANSSDGIFFYDLIDPMDPIEKYIYLHQSDPLGTHLATDNSHFFMAENGRLNIYSLDTIDVPTNLLGSIDLPNLTIWDMATKGKYAYLLTTGNSGGQIVTIDLNDPTSPQIANTLQSKDMEVDTIQYFNKLAVRGDQLLVDCGTENTCVFDIATDPIQPRYLSTQHSNFCDSEFYLDEQNTEWSQADQPPVYFSMTNGKPAYSELDTRECFDFFSYLSYPSAVKDNYILVAQYDAGLLLYRIEPDIDEIPAQLTQIETK